MNPRTSLLCLLLLIATVSVSAQTLPAHPAGALAGPLNLSQPTKAVAEKVPATELEKLPVPLAAWPELPDTSIRKTEEGSAQRMPYGAGYENRRHGMAAGGGGGGGGGRGRGR